MKPPTIRLLLTPFMLLLIFCKRPANVENEEANNHPKDSIAITALVRDMYQWHASEKPEPEFLPTPQNPKDSVYIGIDKEAAARRMEKLESTGFFATEFLSNYSEVVKSADAWIKRDGWHMGDLPPYDLDGDPWCNCQDSPERFWEKLTITNLKTDNGTAAFSWTWGDNFKREARAKKENGKWKISYLEGFDLKYFRP